MRIKELIDKYDVDGTVDYHVTIGREYFLTTIVHGKKRVFCYISDDIIKCLDRIYGIGSLDWDFAFDRLKVEFDEGNRTWYVTEVLVPPHTWGDDFHFYYIPANRATEVAALFKK